MRFQTGSSASAGACNVWRPRALCHRRATTCPEKCAVSSAQGRGCAKSGFSASPALRRRDRRVLEVDRSHRTCSTTEAITRRGVRRTAAWKSPWRLAKADARAPGFGRRLGIPSSEALRLPVTPECRQRQTLDQPAFNRNRLKAEKLIDSRVREQLIRVPINAGCSRCAIAFPSAERAGEKALRVCENPPVKYVQRHQVTASNI